MIAKETRIYFTRGINEAVALSAAVALEVANALERFLRQDWGDLCEEDIDTNKQALETGDRIFAAYGTSKGDIYIITEIDRTITTVLFAEEY